MAKSRIQNLKPPCGYSSEGVTAAWLLDFEDFRAFRFRGDDLYNNCFVEAIFRDGGFTELPAPNTAKYSSAINNKIYAHTLETFIPELSDEILANLHLATRRRFVVVMKLNTGRFFTFGYEAGASLTYAGQTAENIGALVTLTAASIYPLFEVVDTVITDSDTYNIGVDVDYINGAYCELKLA